MRTTGLVVLAAGLLLAGACGGDNSGSSVNTAAGAATAAPSTSTSAASTSTSDPRTQQQLDADKATAQNAVLKLADLPTRLDRHARDRHRRAGATLALQGQGSPFPSDLATSLAQTVAGRLPTT